MLRQIIHTALKKKKQYYLINIRNYFKVQILMSSDIGMVSENAF